jgi:hypothetical protein
VGVVCVGEWFEKFGSDLGGLGFGVRGFDENVFDYGFEEVDFQDC